MKKTSKRNSKNRIPAVVRRKLDPLAASVM